MVFFNYYHIVYFINAMTDKKLEELKKIPPVSRLIRNMSLVDEVIKKIKDRGGKHERTDNV